MTNKKVEERFVVTDEDGDSINVSKGLKRVSVLNCSSHRGDFVQVCLSYEDAEALVFRLISDMAEWKENNDG